MLERVPGVERIIGMPRRPFYPAEHLGSREQSARVNLEGTFGGFEATVAAGRPRRLVYTSSVAAYGYHSDNPVPITQDVPPRVPSEHYYSAQKAACEAALAEAMPWNPVKRVAQALPLLKPPLPDPGNPLQLVHHDDVAAAIALAATTSAPPGAYNLAADGVLSMSEVAEALGALPVRPPRAAVSAASEVIARLPLVPSALERLHVGRISLVMDTTKAKSQLAWVPKHTAAETLSALGEAI